MKTVLLLEKLKQVLQKLEKISQKSLTHPILNTILIKAEKNFLNISATDLEIGIKWWALAKTEQEGETAVPLHLFSSFLNFLPNKPITLHQKNNYLLLECGPYKSQIKTLPPEDFPLIPIIQNKNFIELKTADFCQGLSQVAEIASPSSARPEISGVFLSFQKEAVKMAATDSFRLGEKTIFAEEKGFSAKGMEGETSLIIPQKAARELAGVFGEGNENFKFSFSPNQIMVESQMKETSHIETIFVSRLIEGEYPAYQEIIPKKHDTQIVAPKGEFINHLKAASLFAGKINEVTIKVNAKDSKVEFFSQNQDLGEHRSSLQAKAKGAPLEISFNHRFLAAGLAQIKSAEVIFELQKNEGPAVLKPLGDPSYLYVVMPIKAS
ncbi:MAG: hypothetical protein G01um101430_91 [Parcubacteria group bacterium Gr01-1014_30]|nr:MAG: hypothetical protein G01um101430_91 [Parcubacteria group bacterium Gr01-1014_30]